MTSYWLLRQNVHCTLLLETCKAFSSKYQVKFNPQKSKLIVIDNDDAANHRSIDFDGQIINAQSHDMHLGHIIGNNTRGLSVQKAKDDSIIKMNVLTSYFRHACQCMAVFCGTYSPIMLIYFTPLGGNVSDDYKDSLHNDLLGTICHDIPVEGQIHVRF